MILDSAFVFGFYLNFCSEKRQTVLQAKSFYICLCIVLIYRASRVLVLYTSQRGYSLRVACFFYKRKVGITAICLGLQNALNISDNRSIYNYYAVIIYSGLQLRNFGWGWNRAKEYCVMMINSDKWFNHYTQKKRSKWALYAKMIYHRLLLVSNFACLCGMLKLLIIRTLRICGSNKAQIFDKQ